MKWFVMCLALIVTMSFVAQTRAQEEAKTSLKSVKVFQDKRASGWYLNGWSGGKMVEKTEGIDGSKCLAVTGEPGQGGAGFRTKREGTEYEVPTNDDGQWQLVFYMKPASDVKLKAFSLDESIKTKEVVITKYKVGEPKDGWQMYSIPLYDTAPKIEKFAGIAIRIPKHMPDPILVDNMSLELMPK